MSNRFSLLRGKRKKFHRKSSLFSEPKHGIKKERARIFFYFAVPPWNSMSWFVTEKMDYDRIGKMNLREAEDLHLGFDVFLIINPRNAEAKHMKKVVPIAFDIRQLMHVFG